MTTTSSVAPPASGICADDVLTAWKGFAVSIPIVVSEPSRQNYLCPYVGIVLFIALGFLLVLWECWGWVAFCLLPILCCSVSYNREKKKYRMAVRVRFDLLDQRQKAITRRDALIDRLNTTCRYLGENYHRWIDQGTAELQDHCLLLLGVPKADILCTEVILENEPPLPAPILPQVTEFGYYQYPLPEKVGIAFFFFASEKLIVVPAGAAYALTHDEAETSSEHDAHGDIRGGSGHYLPMDIQAMSLKHVENPQGVSGSSLPLHISSYELIYEDISSIELRENGFDKSFLTIALKDGGIVELLGTSKIAELLRQKVRRRVA
nr:hypothetical protein [Deltaproteobacteria bacterium]